MPKVRKDSEITFDMLRAFESLASTLNLTETAEELGFTRQTVRRHISNLEAVKGGQLFSLNKHAYRLTSLGDTSLTGARSMLRQAEAWSKGFVTNTGSSQHLEYARAVDRDGRSYISHQHPISAVSRRAGPVMKQTLAAWGKSSAQLEAAPFLDVRPFLVLYRRGTEGWICVEIGEQSAYAKWFGWKWSKSAVGQLSQDDNAGDDFNQVIAGAYERIHGEGGIRYDHLFAHLPREITSRPVPVTFQRLLMGCELADETPALAVLVMITRDVEIMGLSPEEASSVTQDLISEFTAHD